MTTKDIVDTIERNAYTTDTSRLAAEHSLAVTSVTWEDTGRAKNSCVGPNISDMTLRVAGRNLPVVRAPNFADITWDAPMDAVQLITGNADGAAAGTRTKVTLTEYLRTLKLHAAERDSHVLVSAQSCYLPIADGGKTDFHVALFNYQSRADDPAVLVIVGSATGSSAQTVGDSRGGNELFFNDAGKRCPFVGERLKDERVRRGVSSEGAMSADETQRNCLIIVQVPLTPQKPRERETYPQLQCASAYEGAMCFSTKGWGGLQPQSKCISRGGPPARDTTDHAMISVGAAVGDFPALPAVMVRDARFPVRVTLQYYKATDNGVISAESMAAVAAQLREARGAFRAGSLVVDGATGRPTETANATLTSGAVWTPFAATK